jgi:uncharacterized protein (TIGR02117 family)
MRSGSTGRKRVRWWRGVALVALAFVMPILAYGVATLAFSFMVFDNSERLPPSASAGPRDVTVYIRSNGVHTDLVVPIADTVKDWRTFMSAQFFRRPDTSHTHMAFGWGDRGFYLEVPTWAELTVGAGLRAMSGQGPAAIHVTMLPTPSESPSMRALRVTRAQYAALVAHITVTFVVDAQGRAMPIASPWQEEHDALFAAKGSYSPLRTCNEWTREGLAAAALPTARWAAFPFAVFRTVELAGAAR